MINEKLLEGYIEQVAIATLQSLKSVFIKQRLSDREATLALAFYIKTFVQHGYIGNKPVDVLENVATIIQEVGGNIPLDLKHKPVK